MIFTGFFRKKDENNELQKLEVELLKLKKKGISYIKKQALKKHLFATLQQKNYQQVLPYELENFSQKIQKVSSRVKLSLPVKIRLKTKVIALIERKLILEEATGEKSFFFYRKGFLALALLFCFVVTSVFYFPFQVPLTSAAKNTYIEETSGQVLIVRNNQIYSAQKDLVLKQGDIILTGQSSSATVRFLDESTGRLGSDGHLYLKKLYVTPQNPSETQVEIELEQGRLWTKAVQKPSTESRFIVDTKEAKAIADEKAAFDVQVLPDKSVLTVFDNSVQVISKDVNTTESQSVTAGLRAEINSTKQTEENFKISPLSNVLAANPSEHAWFATNLELDKIEEKNDKILSLPDLDQKPELSDNSVTPQDEVVDQNPIPQSPNQNDDLVVQSETALEIENQQKHFLSMSESFLRGKELLNSGKGQEGMSLVLEFYNTVRGLSVRLNSFEEKEPVLAHEFRKFMRDEITVLENDLKDVLPGNALYPAKEKIEEMAVLLQPSEFDKVMMILSQSEKQLFSMKNFLDTQNIEMVDKLFVRYKRKISQTRLSSFDMNLSQANKNLLYFKVLEQVEMLLDLENKIKASDEIAVSLHQMNINFMEFFAKHSKSEKFIVPLVTRFKKIQEQMLLHDIDENDRLFQKLNVILAEEGESLETDSSEIQPEETSPEIEFKEKPVLNDSLSLPVLPVSENQQ